MSRSLHDLLALLDLELLEPDVFRGQSPETSLQRVFGGQVAGQALVAAGRTVPGERRVHSLHAYFLRAGAPGVPISYDVDRIRDGRSFSTRRVVARQDDRPIFHMSASFQIEEAGLEHQDPMPSAPDPESLPTLRERAAGEGPGASDWWQEWQSIDLRPVGPSPWGGLHGARRGGGPAGSQVWLRAAAELPSEPMLQLCVLAYASDLTLLSSALVPHGLTPLDVQMASLDHAMWFHRPFRADEWLLYDQSSPSASGGRGLATGRIFAIDGRLVASVVQEGLMRPLRSAGT